MYDSSPRDEGIYMLHVLCNMFIAMVTTPVNRMPEVIVTLICRVTSTHCQSNELL